MLSRDTLAHWTLGLALFAGPAFADTLPAIDGPMVHLLVGLDTTSNAVTIDLSNPNNAALPLLLEPRPGETYTGAAAVLDGRAYDDQYGWLQNGFVQLPAGASLWIEQLTVTAGLDVYDGGMRPVRDTHSYAPIFGTDGSPPRWQWDLIMQHNWYAADTAGDHAATYRVYVGDAAGGALAGYTPADITLHWTAVPEPGGAAFLALGWLGAGRLGRTTV